jgi:hypothetical protein
MAALVWVVRHGAAAPWVLLFAVAASVALAQSRSGRASTAASMRAFAAVSATGLLVLFASGEVAHRLAPSELEVFVPRAMRRS